MQSLWVKMDAGQPPADQNIEGGGGDRPNRLVTDAPSKVLASSAAAAANKSVRRTSQPFPSAGLEMGGQNHKLRYPCVGPRNVDNKTNAWCSSA
jgi:hypothetical protein